MTRPWTPTSKPFVSIPTMPSSTLTWATPFSCSDEIEKQNVPTNEQANSAIIEAFHLKIRSVRPRKTGNNKVLPNLLVGRAERDSAR
jgi:hypothetical protein